MNRKRLLREIELWTAEQLISPEQADAIKKRSERKNKTGTLMVIFSVLGSLLIGAGIIMLFARNWYRLPIALKSVISLLPLIVGQGLAVFTVRKRSESLAWREGVAVFWCAGVFTALAMVSQTFHIANDFGIYVLACGLLCLPIIYILDAVSPLAVYYYAVINWAILLLDVKNAPVLLLLFAGGLVFVIINRKKALCDGRYSYTVWISAIAAYIIVFIYTQGINDAAVFYISLAFFTLMFALGYKQSEAALPYKYFGTPGILVLLLIITGNASAFSNGYDTVSSAGTGDLILIVFSAVMLISAIVISIVKNRNEPEKTLFVSVAAVMCVLTSLYTYSVIDNLLVFILASNLAVLACGIGFIVLGVKNSDIIETNLGLISTCVLIAIRFFDEDIDILGKAVMFMLLGGALLMINFIMLRKKKKAALAANDNESGVSVK